MKKFGKRILASCLASCLLIGNLQVDQVNAKVQSNFIDDFTGEDYNEDDYIVPTIEVESTATPEMEVTVTPEITATPEVVVTTPEITATPEAVVTPEPTEVVVTSTPEVTATPNPFKPPIVSVDEPEYTIDPSQITPAPTFSLERPNVSHYSYYDRMQWEKKNLNKNLDKYDANNGAVKVKNNKIPTRTVKYSKNKKSVTIKVKYGDCIRIKLKGVKKYKRVNYDGGIKSRADLTSWNRVRSTYNGKYRRCVLVNFTGTRKYGFKVNGKIFKVKVKSYGKISSKESSYYEGMGYNSKWTWKTLMRNVTSGATSTSNTSAVINSNSVNSGRTRYCSWDADYFYVQGYAIKKPTDGLSSLVYIGTNVDYLIDHYRIPSASKMTQEQCCKWIRRNAKLLRSIFGVTARQSAGEHYCLGFPLYAIFDKAADYSLDSEYSGNDLVFYHVFDHKPKYKSDYTWLKFSTIPVNIGYRDVNLGCDIDIWTLPTWAGYVYELLKDMIK